MTATGDDWIEIEVLEVVQPIGSFYFGAINHKDLITISYSDIRRIDREQREVESYLGIERPLRKNRVVELQEYVNTVDATFPSPIILAIDEDDVELTVVEDDVEPSIDETGVARQTNARTMRIKNDGNVAQILDGQHRIAGLEGFEGETFDILVTIFVNMDIEYQAMVFATINLEQTKVNKSLAYDLYEYATARSPQKTCHNIARLLNSREHSPFHNKIKVLGIAGERSETISQALFVDCLIPLISRNTRIARKDRDDLKRGKSLERATRIESQTLIFRNLFVEEKDGVIARVLWNYFKAVERNWTHRWTTPTRGYVLNRTTGFRGLMQFLPFAYVEAGGLIGDPIEIEFDDIFARIQIPGHDITRDNYPPGTAGSSIFRDHLKAQAGLA